MTSPAKFERLMEIVSERQSAFLAMMAKEKPDSGEDAIKVFHHTERFAQFLRGNDNLVQPITAELWPSLSCDARCAMCTYTINNARSKDDQTSEITLMRDATFFELADKLKQGRVTSLIFTGGGEPLLNSSIPKYVKHAQNLGMAWGLFTHGLHLNQPMIEQLFDSSPRFIRVSLNGWSPQKHNLEYRLGIEAFEQIVENITVAAKIASLSGNRVGVGFALEPKTALTEMSSLHDTLYYIISSCPSNSLNFAFRPKIPYYLSSGEVRTRLGSQAKYAKLQETLEANVLAPLRNAFGDTFDFDNKSGQFHSAASGKTSNCGLAVGWTSQFDHLGNAFVLSELNGTPFDGANLGNLVDAENFEDFLLKDKRAKILASYFNQLKSMPINSKISHIDGLLGQIRTECGVLNEKQIQSFFSWFRSKKFSKPRNWDFL